MKDNIQPMFHSLYQHELTPVKLFMDYKQNRGREAAEEGRASETGGGREGGRKRKDSVENISITAVTLRFHFLK